MGDLISRQEATEALMMMQGIVAKEGVRKGISMAWQQIKDLPSAQPELIHCKDCKWHNGEINQCSAQICASMRGEDFCSRAERRTDEAD